MTDHTTVRLVIGLVGAVTFLLAAAMSLLAFQEKAVPDSLQTLAAGGLGALTAMLVSTRGGSSSDGGTVTADLTVTAPVDGDDT